MGPILSMLHDSPIAPSPLRRPGVLRRPPDPDIPPREGADGQLGREDRARLLESGNDRGLLRANLVSVRGRAPGGRVARDGEEVLPAPRDPVKITPNCRKRSNCVRLPRLLQGGG